MLEVEDINIDYDVSDRVCMPEPGEHIRPHETINGNRCYVAGWGETSTGYRSSSLMSFKADIFSNVMCKQIFHAHDIDEASEFCAGKMKGSDACQGDSGQCCEK